MFILETVRLRLRDMRLEDEAAFVAITQDERYQRFYSEEDGRAQKYRELTRLFVEQADERPRRAYQLAIEQKTTGNLISTVCLRLEADQQASMGCGMARHSQGRGLMQEAASALAGFGFASLGVHRLYAETLARNRPAIRLCTSLGMRQKAHFREHRYFKGQWWDTAVFALLRSEWSLHHGDTASAARAASRSSHTPNGQADQPARPPQ
ncbi:GNAT family N-acetyltransferase [Aeromonas dhakensis]|uniref:GNAT family N-acetyltransferase n=1 Tax=Aeromonas dhakensis TaxID=196024 RepID=UPI0021AA03D6|nr:GNAT family protein [Aeromonas dhakensis]MDX7696852.1 GNAT family protein [Aeromonas dhakensis]